MPSNVQSVCRILLGPAAVSLSLAYHYAWAAGHFGGSGPPLTLLASIVVAAAVAVYSIRCSVTATTRWPWYVAAFVSLVTIPAFWGLFVDAANNI